MVFYRQNVDRIQNWDGEEAEDSIDIKTLDHMIDLHIHSKAQFDVGTAGATGVARAAFGIMKSIECLGDRTDTIWSLNSLEQMMVAQHYAKQMVGIVNDDVTSVATDLTVEAWYTLPLNIPKDEYNDVEVVFQSGDIDEDVIEESGTSVTTLDRYDIEFACKYSTVRPERIFLQHGEQVASASSSVEFKPRSGHRLLGAIVYTEDNQDEPSLGDDLEDNIDEIQLEHGNFTLHKLFSHQGLEVTSHLWDIPRDNLTKVDLDNLAYVYAIPTSPRKTTTNTILTVTTNGDAADTDDIDVTWILSAPKAEK